MTHFIKDDEVRIIITRGNDVNSAPKRLVEGRDPTNCIYSSLVKGKVNTKMEPLYVEFSQVAKAKVAPLSHHGDEFVHVLEGKLEVTYEGDVVVLDAGDSLYLDARIPHSYRSLTKKRTRAIMVVTE